MTGWGCETRSGRESGRLKCRSAETPWALVSAGLAVFEKDLGHWPLRQPADPCHQSISRPALWRAGDSWDGRALQAADAAGMSLRAALIAVDRPPVVPSLCCGLRARPRQRHHASRGKRQDAVTPSRRGRAGPPVEGPQGALSSRLRAPAPARCVHLPWCASDAMLEMTAPPSARPDQRGPSLAATSSAQS